MSTSHVRPIVPPKPDKDRIINNSNATTTQGGGGVEGNRQTVSTQTNMLSKPFPSTPSKPNDLPGTSTVGPKPALPPKPKAGVGVRRPPPPSHPVGSLKSASDSSTACKTSVKCESSAPVARLEEFDNLNPTEQSKPVSPKPPPLTLKPPLSSTARSLSPSSPRNSVQSPPISPRNSTFLALKNAPLSPRSPVGQVSQNLGNRPLFPNAPKSSLFNPHELSIRQAKSASLGRTVNFAQFANPKKSTTLNRISPLDLSFSLAKKSPHSAPVIPNRPINFPRPVSFASAESHAQSNGIPPPPPPRMKKAQKSVSSPITSPTSTSSPISPPPPAAPPVYATVDKEKKWAARLAKQVTETEELDSKIVTEQTGSPTDLKNDQTDPNEPKIEAPMEIPEPAEETKDVGTVLRSSLTVTTSWLAKLIDAEVQSDLGNIISCIETTEQVMLESQESTRKDEINSLENSSTNNNNDKHDPLSRNESYLLAMQVAEPSGLSNSSHTTPARTSPSTNNTLLADIIEQLNPEEQQQFHNSNCSSPCLPNNSSSVPDEFEIQLENQLESSEEARSLQLTSATFTEADEKVKLLREKYLRQKAFQKVSSAENPADPRAYLELVDERLQSMQTLIASIQSPSTSEGGEDDAEGGDKSLENSKNPETSSNNSRQSDGEIITDILLTSKRFENNKLVRRMSTDNKLESCSSYNNEKPECSSQQQQQQPSNPPTQIPNVDEQPFLRRSWTCSDYSPSPSESSSTSSSMNNANMNAAVTRRKQTASWLEEDDLSAGALADAESSDLVPSSSEDIESSTGTGTNRKKTKRGITSIFSSFGKGETQDHPGRRSQFFVSEDGSENPRRDRTGSLPAARSVSVDETQQQQTSREQTKNHRPLVRSTGSAFALLNSAATLAATATNVPEISPVLETQPPSSIPTGYEDVLAQLDPSQRKSFFVAREILTSEQTFLDVLNLLTIDFPNAVRAASETGRMAIIGKNDLDFILGGLPTLKTVNQVLVDELKERIPRWKELPKVADIIVKKGPFLKHYSTYVRDFEKIMHRLDHCCHKYSAFARTVREFEATERCQKLGLKHYMLKPVQRMPQYRLLLEDYLKTLTEESEDYEDTIKAITIVKDVAEHANEAINLQISTEKLMNLQNRLPGTVVLKANRFLVKEGELMKVCRKELQPRYFALMTDCLLCMNYNASSGAPSSKDLKLRYELPLAGMRISLPQSESYSNEFTIISTIKSFNLCAKHPKERDEWMKAITRAIQDNMKKRACNSPDLEKEFRIGHEAPVWTPDKRVTMCQVCTAEFTYTFRRHHCRACGKVVCGNCSGNTAPLQYRNNEADRVCDDCYQYLLEEFDKENSMKDTEEINEIRSRFKKLLYNTTGRKTKKAVPEKFKNPANNSGCQISGYLNWKERKAWKRQWFVLQDRVLYVYAASEDIIAGRTIPVLGYQVEPVVDEQNAAAGGGSEGLMFKLAHSNQPPILFQAENSCMAEKWMTAIQEASVLT